VVGKLPEGNIHFPMIVPLTRTLGRMVKLEDTMP
jgi:hypothetical protein